MSVSVVIPLFNGASFIERALISVETQIVSPSEVIVVDDGSTDGGGDLVERKFPHVAVLRQSNQGEGPARNAGIRQASSDWVAFLDADDIWGHNHLEMMAKAARHGQRPRFLGSIPLKRRVTNEKLGSNSRDAVAAANTHLYRRRPLKPHTIRTVDYFAVSAGKESVTNSSSTVVHRSVFIEDGRWFPEDALHADLATWCHIALLHPLTLVNHPTTLITRSPESVSERRRTALAGAEPTDCTAFREKPHYRVVDEALKMGSPGVSTRRNLERYADGIVTRHWPTVLLYGEQRCARVATQSLWAKRAALRFIAAGLLPDLIGRLVSRSAIRLARRLGMTLPVSPFASHHDPKQGSAP